MIAKRLHTFLRQAVQVLNPWHDLASQQMFATLGLTVDACAEAIRLGAWLRLGLWPNDEYHPRAIPIALRILGLPVYRADYSAAYPLSYAEGLATIALRWTLHAQSGTPGGLASELERVGLTAPVIEEDGFLSGAPSSFGVQSPDFGAPTAWGAADWGTFLWDVSGPSLEDAERYEQTIQFWRPARSYCVRWVPG